MTTTKLTRYFENMSHHLAFVHLSESIELNCTMQNTHFSGLRINLFLPNDQSALLFATFSSNGQFPNGLTKNLNFFSAFLLLDELAKHQTLIK